MVMMVMMVMALSSHPRIMMMTHHHHHQQASKPRREGQGSRTTRPTCKRSPPPPPTPQPVPLNPPPPPPQPKPPPAPRASHLNSAHTPAGCHTHTRCRQPWGGGTTPHSSMKPPAHIQTHKTRCRHAVTLPIPPPHPLPHCGVVGAQSRQASKQASQQASVPAAPPPNPRPRPRPPTLK